MPQDDSAPQEHKTRQVPIPPLILGGGSLLWKFLDVAGRVDFILRVEDQTFAAIFQAFVSYGWLVLTVGSAIWGFLAFRKQQSTGEETGFKATPGMVVAVGSLAFLYGVLITVSATGSIPNVTAGWGPTPTGCQLGVDTSRLSIFKNKYYLVGICGLTDPGVDKLQQTGITISKPFTITPGGVAIFALYSPEMARAVNQGIAPTTGTLTSSSSIPPGSGTGVGTGAGIGLAPGSAVTVPGMWYQPVLVPKDADLSKIGTLSDVKRQGGKILSPAYFE